MTTYHEKDETFETFLDLLSHWEGEHIRAADSYEEAGGNPNRLSFSELRRLHSDEH